jgi:hypothetical protein
MPLVFGCFAFGNSPRVACNPGPVRETARMRLLLFAIAVGTSCASNKTTRFTSAETLKEVMKRPRPDKVFTSKNVEVAEWQLKGALPDSYADAPHETQSLFAPLFIEAAGITGFTASDALACIARETAGFLVEKGGFPTRGLASFIEARCGVASNVSVNSLTGEAPDSLTDAELLAQWKPNVVKLAQAIGQGSRAGVGFVRENGKAVVIVAQAREETTLETLPMKPADDGYVWIRGVTKRHADSVSGTVNQGRTGSAQCVNTEARAAPSFELKCPVAKDDEWAWLSLSAREKGRVLGFELVRVVVRPSGAEARTYRAPTLVAQAPGTTVQDFTTQLNSVRTQVGATPLVLSDPQSADLKELTPFFFEALTAKDAAKEDMLALGVMAGWRVAQEIMHGTFAASAIEGTTASELLSAMLDSPSYRQALLSPRAGVLAAGLLQEGQTMGGVVATYELVQAPKWPDTANDILTALNGQRARNGKKPIQWVLMPSNLEATFSEAVAKRQYDSDEAMRRFMNQASDITRRQIRAYKLTVFDLNDFDWPAEVLSRDSLDVMFFVTTERVAGDPWGHYVLVLLMLEGGGQPEA